MEACFQNDGTDSGRDGAKRNRIEGVAMPPAIWYYLVAASSFFIMANMMAAEIRQSATKTAQTIHS